MQKNRLKIILQLMDSTLHRLPRILMLPWLGHGHVSPYLELAKRLVSQKNGFQVFICSTPVNLSHFRQSSNLSCSIEFVDLHLPSTPELPPDHHSTKNLPPDLMPVLKTAFDEAKDTFHGILRELKPDLVIYDFLQPWAPIVARKENIPAVLFLTISASTSAFLYHHTRTGLEEDYPVPEFNFSKPVSENIVQFMYDVSNGMTNKERYFQCIHNSSRFIIIKTLDEIENKHLTYLSELVEKEVIPVGLLVQEPERNLRNSSDSAIFMEWLDKREDSSAVFVSFGTEYFLSKEEIEEVAYGLELSMVSFIWVVRFHGTANFTAVKEVLPDGFLERVKDRGMVVEGWAPQAEILRHSSIGGFVSHCGWSSTLESLSFGVPIIAVPMHLDQPLNGRLVAEIEVGIEIPRENGKFRREEIARVIREVVVEENGEKVRKKVKEMSAAIKMKADQEVDHAVKMLMHLITGK